MAETAPSGSAGNDKGKKPEIPPASKGSKDPNAMDVDADDPDTEGADDSGNGEQTQMEVDDEEVVNAPKVRYTGI